MSHLSIERLAALADEQPTADEHSHLMQCADCAREREAHQSLLALAGSERDSMGLPLTRWDVLAPKLRAEGLIVKSGTRGRAGLVRGAFGGPHRFLQLAAGLLLVAGGALFGRHSAGASLLPGGLTGAEGSQPAPLRVSRDALPPTFSSVDEAAQLKDLYRTGYQRALSYLAQHDSSARNGETPAVMRTRLSALDRVYGIAREALDDAPFDPVINDFYLNSFGQREATLRELNTVLPQNVRLNSF